MKQVTENKLRSWLEECYRTGASHMLLVVDRSEDFVINPVKVSKSENVDTIELFYSQLPETEVVEIYSMKHSLEEQMSAFEPVFNY